MKKEVIVALDFPTVEESLEFLEKFGDEKLFVKIGLELYLQRIGSVSCGYFNRTCCRWLRNVESS